MTNLPNDMGTAGGDPARVDTSTGMDPHVAGLLTYLFGWITGLIFFLVEKKNREVRFHAAQSLLLSIGLIVVYIVLAILRILPYIGFIFLLAWIVVALASFALWIFLLIQGYKLKHFKLPVIGDIAEQWAAKY